MTRLALICIALISLPAITDWLVDRQFRIEHPDQNIGYSKEDRDRLARLVESAPGTRPLEALRSNLRYQFPFSCSDDGRDCLIVASNSKRPMPRLKLAKVADTDEVRLTASDLAKRGRK